MSRSGGPSAKSGLAVSEQPMLIRAETVLRKRAPAVALLLLLAPANNASAQGPPTAWTVIYELSGKFDVAVDPKRLFHGPAAVVAANGDWLVSYQDSDDHGGNDGVISQVRSSDRGKTWKRDGIVFDQRLEKYFGRNPAYGVTEDGRLVLVVQRWRPLPPGQKFILEREQGMHGSVYLISKDNGRTYEYKGLVDPGQPLRHQGTTSPIVRVGHQLLMLALTIGVEPRGITLYRTDDPAKGWEFAGWVFPSDRLPVKYVSYPSLVVRKDGSLLAQAVFYSRNFQSISRDNGRTWSPLRELPDLKIRSNPDLHYANDVLIAHGRGEDGLSVVVYFSPDEGETWGLPIVVDRHGFRGGGGYSASLRTRDGKLLIVFSTDAGPNTAKNGGKPDIRGVLLGDVEIRRPLQ